MTAGAATLLWPRLEVSPARLGAQLLETPEFLADHPEILSAANQVLQTRALAEEGRTRLQLMGGEWKFLLHAGNTPTLGEATAPDVLLEFTDYSCVPCRRSAPLIREATAHRKDLRTAVLLLPTGGPLAEYAARIAVAAYRQNPQRLEKLHRHLMEQEGALTQQSIEAAVEATGFDLDQITREVMTPSNRRYLAQVREFSLAMKIPGVPALALNEGLLVGGVKASQVEALLKQSSMAQGLSSKAGSALPAGPAGS